jgi:hypothetical protein
MSDNQLKKRGPITSLPEQWTSLLFLTLQPRGMAGNYPLAESVKISQFALENGAGVREPLAETFRPSKNQDSNKTLIGRSERATIVNY